MEMRSKSIIFRLSPLVERESRQSTTVSKISPEICYPRTSHQKLRSETRFRTVAESNIAAPVPAELTIVLAHTSSSPRTFFRSDGTTPLAPRAKGGNPPIPRVPEL